MSYLLKYKGQYRLKAPIDLRTNEFLRDEKGNYYDHDIYIDCKGGNQIYHYGGKELVAYIPSIGRAKNIIKKLKEMGKKDVVLKILESDEEMLIHFHVKDIELMAELCKVRTSGASISPFSVKNLRKTDKSKPNYNKYEIPAEHKEQYKKMFKLLKEWISKSGLVIGKAYDKFYVEFGKVVKMDLVKESKNKNYKVLHIIVQNNLLNEAIDFLEKKLK
jgi:hypothetical protein